MKIKKWQCDIERKAAGTVLNLKQCYDNIKPKIKKVKTEDNVI